MAKRVNGVAEFALVGRTLQWTYGPGMVVAFTVPDHGLPPRDDAAMVFGFKQTLADAAAVDRNTPIEGKYAAMAKRAETLETGVWRAERVATGGGANMVFLAQAIAKVRGKAVWQDVLTWLRTKTADECAALAANATYAKEIAKLAAVKVAQSGILVADLEGEIDGI